eukprot:s8528_g1.t1
MQLTRRSGRPTVVPAPEADLGPIDGGEIAVMLIDFGSPIAFGSPEEATSPCPRTALPTPTDEETSRVPAGPVLNFGGGGDVTGAFGGGDVTGLSTLGEGADPLVRRRSWAFRLSAVRPATTDTESSGLTVSSAATSVGGGS